MRLYKRSGTFRRGEMMMLFRINSKRGIGSLFLLMILLMMLIMIPETITHAAFPPDIKKKPVWCSPLFEAPSEIDYFSDRKLKNWKGHVDKNQLVLQITKSTQKAVYGTFDQDGRQETGWFDIRSFVSDPDYEHIYATVRRSMPVYTDSTLEERQDKIRKYSGVILISREGDSRQVIYQKRKKDAYGIGWMSEEDLEKTLVYDGREKQALCNGTYLFRPGYVDDPEGGAPVRIQIPMTGFRPFSWELIHSHNDQYYIKDPKSSLYLTVYTLDGGLSYGLYWAKEPDRVSGLFHLDRANGSFTIRNVKADLYLGESERKNLILERFRFGNPICWRISAPKRMIDGKKPFVFTQYDPAWCGTAYGSEGCMGTAGCGILATVNAVYALSGQYMDVMELADYAVEEEYRIPGSGTDEGIFKAACIKYGGKYNFDWDGHGKKIKQLKKKLAQGDTAVVHVDGHYVCIAAYDEERDRFLLLDSNYLPKREDTAFGDWISPVRLKEGALEAQRFYYFKLRDPLKLPPCR